MAKNHLAKGASVVIKREIETAVMKDREAFSSVAAEVLNCMALITLHDKFGFGTKRLNEFQKHFETQAECLTEDFVTIEEMKELVEELTAKIKTFR